MTLIVVTAGQRCDKGNKVCQKLEADDPVFQGQRCETPADCKGKCIYIRLACEGVPGEFNKLLKISFR